MKRKVLILCITLAPFVLTQAEENPYLFSPKGIAEIHITMLNGKNWRDIQNEKATDNYQGKLEARMVIKNSASSTYSEETLYNGKIFIDGRGNTSWHISKRPYGIDLITENGEDNPFPVLGMPADEEWVLHNLGHDKSLLRLPLALYMGTYMEGFPWVPRFCFVEVWFGDEYRGLYGLTEKIKRSDSRIKIKKLDPENTKDQQEPNISGGYILEAAGDPGKLKDDEKWTRFETSQYGIPLLFKYPKPKNATQAQLDWIKNYLTQFETVLKNKELFKDPENGFRKYMDEESLIDWTILHELSYGPDNQFNASVFIQKDRNDKMRMTAPWDFDLSFGTNGNADYGKWLRGKYAWFYQVDKDEKYHEKYTQHYDLLMPLFEALPRVLNENLQQLNDAGCIARDTEQYPGSISDKPSGDNYTFNTRDAHVRWLSDWIQSRKTWIYIDLAQTDEERCKRIEQSKPTIRIMNPENFESGRSTAVKIMPEFTYIWNDGKTTDNENYTLAKKNFEYTVQIKDKTTGCISQPSRAVKLGKKDTFEDLALPGTDPLAIEKISPDNTLSIYPNPAKDIIFVSCSSKENSPVIVQLFDVKGNFIKEYKSTMEFGENRFELNISDYNSGFYIIKYITDTEIKIGKITKI